MTSHQSHPSIHRHQRERERNQRLIDRHNGNDPGLMGSSSICLPVDNSSGLLFAEPIKKMQDQDETASKIKSALGSFDKVLPVLLSDDKKLIGISNREITRIEGKKAKMKKIFDEIQEFPRAPITALDEPDDDVSIVVLSNGHEGENAKILLSDFDSPDQEVATNRSRTSGFQKDCRKDDVHQDSSSSPSSSSSSSSGSGSESSSDSSESDGEDDLLMEALLDRTSPQLPSSSPNPKAASQPTPTFNPSQGTSSTGNSGVGSWDLSAFVAPGPTRKGHDRSTENNEASITSIIEDVVKGVPPFAVSLSSPSTPATQSSNQESLSSPSSTRSLTPPRSSKKRTSSTDSPRVLKQAKMSQSEKQAAKVNEVSPTSKKLPSSSSKPPILTPAAKKLLSEEQQDKYKVKSSSRSKISNSIKKESQDTRSSSVLKENVSEKVLPPPTKIICSISLDKLARVPGVIKKEDNFDRDVKKNGKTVTNGKSSSTSEDRESVEKKYKTSGKSGKNSSSFPPIESSSSKKKSRSDIRDEERHSPPSTTLKPDSNKSRGRSKNSMMEDVNASCHESKPKQTSPPQVINPVAAPKDHVSPKTSDPTSQTPTTSSRIPRVYGGGGGEDVPVKQETTSPPDLSSSEFFLKEAKNMKHLGDSEKDRMNKHCKYIEAVLYFILAANAMEVRILNSASGEKDSNGEWRAFHGLLQDTLKMFKHITSTFLKSRPPNQEVPASDHKLCALSYRIQSVIQLRLSKLRQKEVHSNNKILLEMPEIPKVKDETVTLPAQLYGIVRRQLVLLQELSSAHDSWSQADYLIDRHFSCKAFFQTLDKTECKPLSLTSTFDELVKYVRAGLQILH